MGATIASRRDPSVDRADKSMTLLLTPRRVAESVRRMEGHRELLINRPRTDLYEMSIDLQKHGGTDRLELKTHQVDTLFVSFSKPVTIQATRRGKVRVAIWT